MNKQLVIASALTAVLGGTLAAPVLAADLEPCYGIAAAGQNSCKANGHSCAGQATKDNDPKEFRVVAKGVCTHLKGTLKPM
ncbi:BufA1 family periplasmic bufferin-type metallophore [Andreprevotia chitinilytica]|uniref:BufA1 family periplasmic bufferin-type metallophore n=1 Tax=Andreprevotia chitinilytica TaxID=396808 RepID=UPI0005544EA0|nr:DUF2282 domain-containing protein [Andreprevotia chitinilytica]